ncbi:hypothetical protein BCR34DRAFT_580758 [Clohesyomyces aquaticus]|uniref:Uncharacterized protein n=1 Tax=Clohesyomyces aquaticus TaxID=1231657 RepID=A0A1Y1Y502_9PLEO|nr:hypothetical protein BCR34DRAFT_580758 [Clohesyomyces aquaticus]
MAELKDPLFWKYIDHVPDPLDPEQWVDETKKYEFNTIADLHREGLMLHKRQKSEELKLPPGAYGIVWATRFYDWACERYEQEKEKHAQQLVTALALRRLSHFHAFPGWRDSQDSDGESEFEGSNSDGKGACDQNAMLSGIEKDLENFSPGSPVPESWKSFESTTAVDSPPTGAADLEATDFSTQTPTTPTLKDRDGETPAQARARRRATQYNMGFKSPTTPPTVYGMGMEATRRVSTDVEERLTWEEMLDRALNKEKERQSAEAKKLGRRGVMKHPVLRRDPAFEFDESSPSPRKLHFVRETLVVRDAGGDGVDYRDMVGGRDEGTKDGTNDGTNNGMNDDFFSIPRPHHSSLMSELTVTDDGAEKEGEELIGLGISAKGGDFIDEHDL